MQKYANTIQIHTVAQLTLILYWEQTFVYQNLEIWSPCSLLLLLIHPLSLNFWQYDLQHLKMLTRKVSLKVRAPLPRIVIEGVSFPSLKRVSLSIFAYGSFGFGSLGVPSTLAHLPMVLSHPTMLFKTQQWSYRKKNPVHQTTSAENPLKHQRVSALQICWY